VQVNRHFGRGRGRLSTDLERAEPLGRKAFQRRRVLFLEVNDQMADEVIAFSTPFNVPIILRQHAVTGDELEVLVQSLKVRKRWVGRADLRFAARILRALLDSAFQFPASPKTCKPMSLSAASFRAECLEDSHNAPIVYSFMTDLVGEDGEDTAPVSTSTSVACYRARP
jgi:hypothetical protein